ncbi:zinc-finger homeodomain protein 9 [Pistacia vera]|uniref:zinc-finger homeodomain protein 9 n=1 Tax=Pistacia vera TaxID=55513 RepID=UPI001262AD7E|nr:zinc-finger homeodomain protein 9 [Pistacia vera]
MDLTPASKSPETESTETAATKILPAKHLAFTNGVLKRHQVHHHQHHGGGHPHSHHHHPIVITYKECLKNHAASLGGHALDGCGEFMPSPTATSTDPTSLKCAACGCHRNFHRRDPDDPSFAPTTPHATANPNTITTATIEYQPHHRHHPPPPPSSQAQPPPHRSPSSSSPPPISSSYYPSAPHMLLALSGNLSGHENVMNNVGNVRASSRKRFRTKFSQKQKEKMLEFAERVGWKMQKRDDEMVQEFCNEVGVDRTVLKVWMHNNKNTFGRRESLGGEKINLESNGNNGGGEEGEENNINTTNTNNINIESESVAHVVGVGGGSGGGGGGATANGSSSSS